nr:MAG TPA: hypothetical protein [Caudoviricetes sp.]
MQKTKYFANFRYEEIGGIRSLELDEHFLKAVREALAAVGISVRNKAMLKIKYYDASECYVVVDGITSFPMEENCQGYGEVLSFKPLEVVTGNPVKFIPNWHKGTPGEKRRSAIKERRVKQWKELALDEDVDGYIHRAFKCPKADIVRQKGVGYICTLHEDYDTTLKASNPCYGFSTTIRYNSKELSIDQSLLDRFLNAWSYYLEFQVALKIQRGKLNAEGLTLSAVDGLVNMCLQIRIGIKDETSFAFHKLDRCYALLDDECIDAYVPSGLDAAKTKLVLDVIENLSYTAIEHKREDSLCNVFVDIMQAL